MSAKIIDFPCEAAQLELDGYALIAWRRGDPGILTGRGWLHAIWRPADGRGWYQSGWFSPGISGLYYGRASRSRALGMWRNRFPKPYEWHRLYTEAAAFPEKKRRYARPPRATRMVAHA